MAGMRSITGSLKFKSLKFHVDRCRGDCLFQIQEIPQDLLADRTALFGVELGGVEVILVQCGTEGNNIIRDGSRELADGDVVAVHEIDVVAIEEALKETLPGSFVACFCDAGVAGRCQLQPVPPHVGHFLLMSCGLEEVYINREDAEAVGVALLGVAAEELLSDADAQDRLLE